MSTKRPIDAVHCLTKAVYDSGGQNEDEHLFYYDASGNRTRHHITGGNTTLYYYNAANRMTSQVSSDATVSYYYDDRGLLTVADSDSGDDYTYEWNYSGRLSKVNENAAEVLEVGYDPYGWIVMLEDDSGIHRFVRDGEDILWQCDSSWNKSRAYVNDPMTGLPLMWEEYSLVGEAAAVPYYVSIGGTDRVRTIVDASQALLTKYAYDALAKPTETHVYGSLSERSIVRQYLLDYGTGLLLSGCLNIIDTSIDRYLPRLGEVPRGLHPLSIGSDFHPTFGETKDAASKWSPHSPPLIQDPSASLSNHSLANAYHPFISEHDLHIGYRGPGGHGDGDTPASSKAVDLIAKWNQGYQLRAMFDGYIFDSWQSGLLWSPYGFQLPPDTSEIHPESQTEDFFLYFYPFENPPFPALRKVPNPDIKWPIELIFHKHIGREPGFKSNTGMAGHHVGAGSPLYAHNRRHLWVPEAYYEPHVHMEFMDPFGVYHPLYHVDDHWTIDHRIVTGWDPEDSRTEEKAFFLSVVVPMLSNIGWGQSGVTGGGPRLDGDWFTYWSWVYWGPHIWNPPDWSPCTKSYQGYSIYDIPCFSPAAGACYCHYGNIRYGTGTFWCPAKGSEHGGECYRCQDESAWHYFHDHNPSHGHWQSYFMECVGPPSPPAQCVPRY